MSSNKDIVGSEELFQEVLGILSNFNINYMDNTRIEILDAREQLENSPKWERLDILGDTDWDKLKINTCSILNRKFTEFNFCNSDSENYAWRRFALYKYLFNKRIELKINIEWNDIWITWLVNDDNYVYNGKIYYKGSPFLMTEESYKKTLVENKDNKNHSVSDKFGSVSDISTRTIRGHNNDGI